MSVSNTAPLQAHQFVPDKKIKEALKEQASGMPLKGAVSNLAEGLLMCVCAASTMPDGKSRKEFLADIKGNFKAIRAGLLEQDPSLKPLLDGLKAALKPDRYSKIEGEEDRRLAVAREQFEQVIKTKGVLSEDEMKALNETLNKELFPSQTGGGSGGIGDDKRGEPPHDSLSQKHLLGQKGSEASTSGEFDDVDLGDPEALARAEARLEKFRNDPRFSSGTGKQVLDDIALQIAKRKSNK